MSERTVKRIVARALSTLRHKLSLVPVGADLAAALAAPAHGAGADISVGAGSGGGAAADAGDVFPMKPADSDRHWRRIHQITVAAAAMALLAVGIAPAFLGAPPADEPDPVPTAPIAEPAGALPLLEETGTTEGLTWVRVAAGSHPLDRAWCTDADGVIHLPQPVDEAAAPLSDAIQTSGDSDTPAVTYLFDLPSGTYELHVTDADGNDSHGPLTVTLYPEP